MLGPGEAARRDLVEGGDGGAGLVELLLHRLGRRVDGVEVALPRGRTGAPGVCGVRSADARGRARMTR
jgi:hypothetical protein